jgi:hypothetical protein
MVENDSESNIYEFISIEISIDWKLGIEYKK